MCNISRSKHIVTLAFAGLVGATVSTAALAMHGGGMGGMGGHQGGGFGGHQGGGHQAGFGGFGGGHQGGGHQGGSQQGAGNGTGGHQGGGHKGTNKQVSAGGTGGHQGGGHKGTNKQASNNGTGAAGGHQGGGHKGANKQASNNGTGGTGGHQGNGHKGTNKQASAGATGGQQGSGLNTTGTGNGSSSNGGKGSNAKGSGNNPSQGANGKNGGNRWPVAGNGQNHGTNGKNGGNHWPVVTVNGWNHGPNGRWPVAAYRPNRWAGSYYAAPVYVAPAYVGSTDVAPAYVGSSSASAPTSAAYDNGPSYSGRSVAPSNDRGSKAHPTAAVAAPMFVFVKFQDKSSDADKDGFLRTYDLTFVDGPDSDGFFKLRLAKPLPSDQFKAMIESMEAQTAVVSFVDSKAGPTVAPAADSGAKVAPAPVAAADPTFVFVKFQDSSSDADKDGFLKAYDLDFVEGPDKGGFFKLRLENTVSPDQLKDMIKSMESQTKVVSEVDG